jgi:hypothetical protein
LPPACVLSSRPFLFDEKNRIVCDSRHGQNLDSTPHFDAASSSLILPQSHSKHADGFS